MNNIDFLMNNLIAHRGFFDASLGIPENSLASFQMAVDFNYTIELDIRILNDNTIIVFHDDNLKRMTGIDKSIYDYTYKELKKIKLLNSSEIIPTLNDVLKLVDGKVPLLIELKSDKNIKRLEIEAMRLLRKYKGLFAIQSFNPMCIYYFRKNYPSIPRGQLSHSHEHAKIPYIIKYILKNMLLNFITKPDFISYDIHSCNPNKIIKWKEKRLVLGWTVRNIGDYKTHNDLFDNLICENMEEYVKKR